VRGVASGGVVVAEIGAAAGRWRTGLAAGRPATHTPSSGVVAIHVVYPELPETEPEVPVERRQVALDVVLVSQDEDSFRRAAIDAVVVDQVAEGVGIELDSVRSRLGHDVLEDAAAACGLQQDPAGPRVVDRVLTHDAGPDATDAVLRGPVQVDRDPGRVVDLVAGDHGRLAAFDRDGASLVLLDVASPHRGREAGLVDGDQVAGHVRAVADDPVLGDPVEDDRIGRGAGDVHPLHDVAATDRKRTGLDAHAVQASDERAVADPHALDTDRADHGIRRERRFEPEAVEVDLHIAGDDLEERSG
jgi:hypothetical protein